jgi:hypothetical protein
MFVAIIGVLFLALTIAFTGRLGAEVIGQSGRDFVYDYRYIIVLAAFVALNIWLWA